MQSITENALSMGKRHGKEVQAMIQERKEARKALGILHRLEHDDLEGRVKDVQIISRILIRQTEQIAELRSLHYEKIVLLRERHRQEVMLSNEKTQEWLVDYYKAYLAQLKANTGEPNSTLLH
jgi:hypothetical protein